MIEKRRSSHIPHVPLAAGFGNVDHGQLVRVVGRGAELRQSLFRGAALAQKEGQIDTLWFLSRYDVEAGDTKAAAAKLEKLLEGRFSPLNYVTRETAEKELERLKGAN